MKKILRHIPLFLILICLSGCAKNNEDQFIMYISEEDEEINLDSAVILFTTDDIIVYDWEAHEIKLNNNAADRFKKLNPPVDGLPFAILLGQEQIYEGYIWPLYSSLSHDGIIIEYPLGKGNILRIAKGYPGEVFFSGEDFRGDQSIYDCLLEDKKIKP